MMKQVLLLLLLFLVSGFSLSVSESQAASLLPHAAESFNVSYIQVLLLTTASHEPKYKIETLWLFLILSFFFINKLVLFLRWRLIILIVYYLIAEERGELFLFGGYIY